MSGRRGETVPRGAEVCAIGVCQGCGAAWVNAVGRTAPKVVTCLRCPKKAT